MVGPGEVNPPGAGFPEVPWRQAGRPAVQLHLPLVRCRELADFEIDGDQSTQAPVIEE
jgi:hypothetical protein